MLYNNGDFYIGEWRHNRKHGTGIYYFTNPNETKLYAYDGEWKNDIRHGKGKSYRLDGNTYEGNWKEGIPHG